jgi:hypothetical protein
MKTDFDTVIVAERRDGHAKRSFTTWEKARFWRENIKPDPVTVTLTETILDDLPEGVIGE